VRTPTVIVHSGDDDIASLKNVRIVERGVRAPVETVLLDDSYHMVTVDRQRGELIDRSAEFFRRIAEAEPERVPAAAIAAAIE
jgi:carboxylesterase